MKNVFHPWAWLIWFVAALMPILFTRNPLYLSVIVLAQGINLSALATSSDLRGWRPFLLLILWILPISTLFNVLTVHYGDHVWARLPRSWPVIGGPLTGEAVLFGLASGLNVLALILTFATFNADMPPGRWLRLVPAAFFQAGLVTAIAVTFVPATVAAARDIYQAQRLRGHRFQRITDYAPLFAPLVVDSLERSVQLAQSMAARGFAAAIHPPSRTRRLLLQGGVWLSLVLVLLSLILSLLHAGDLRLRRGMLLLAGGTFLIILYGYGRGVRRTRYRRWYWRPRDTLLVLGSMVLLLVTVTTREVAAQRWFYYPYPPYPLLPDFRWIPGIMLTLIALPALLRPKHTSGGAQ